MKLLLKTGKQHRWRQYGAKVIEKKRNKARNQVYVTEQAL